MKVTSSQKRPVSISNLERAPGTRQRAPFVRFQNEAAVTVPVVVKLDLSDPAQLVESARDAEKIFGTVDILVNNGGISVRSSVNDAQMPTFRRVMEINYFGAVTLTKCESPYLTQVIAKSESAVSFLQGNFFCTFQVCCPGC